MEIDKNNSEFINEFDYLISQGWWFSVTPKNKMWNCAIYRLEPGGTWANKQTKQFKTILKGMVWVENYLMNKIDK